MSLPELKINFPSTCSGTGRLAHKVQINYFIVESLHLNAFYNLLVDRRIWMAKNAHHVPSICIMMTDQTTGFVSVAG